MPFAGLAQSSPHSASPMAFSSLQVAAFSLRHVPKTRRIQTRPSSSQERFLQRSGPGTTSRETHIFLSYISLWELFYWRLLSLKYTPTFTGAQNSAAAAGEVLREEGPFSWWMMMFWLKKNVLKLKLMMNQTVMTASEYAISKKNMTHHAERLSKLSKRQPLVLTMVSALPCLVSTELANRLPSRV